MLLSSNGAMLDADAAAWELSAVQVPPYVAQRWRQAIEQAGNAAIDEDARGEVLGQITLEHVGIPRLLTAII